ncbi:MAG: hypothetical protein WCK39_00565 [Methanomassiliicoccales archaeon]
MSEDSKAMAHAGSHGMKVTLTGQIDAASLQKTLEAIVLAIGKRVVARRGVIGHIKAIASCDLGFVKSSIVDLDLGPETTVKMQTGSTDHAEMNLMAVALKIDDDRMARVLKASLRTLPEGFHAEIEEHAHGH